MSTERMRHRSNDADFTFAVIEGVTPRGLTEFIGKLAHGTKRIQLFQNFIHGDDDVRRPHAVFFQRHEFNEPDNHALFPREAREFDDLVFIETAQKNAVDLYWLQPSALGGTDTGQHTVIAIGNAGNAGEL